MRLLSIVIILLSISTPAISQVTVIDRVVRNIGSLNPNTSYEIRIDEIEDGRIKIRFNPDTTRYTNYFGEIYLRSNNDLKDLYYIIIEGFNQKKDHVTYVDIDNQMKLTLRFTYSKILFENSSLQISYYYYDEPYDKFSTKTYSEKDIKKLFGKI